MIVCLCHRVSNRDIERAVREGTSSFEVLQEDTRVSMLIGVAVGYELARTLIDPMTEGRD